MSCQLFPQVPFVKRHLIVTADVYVELPIPSVQDIDILSQGPINKKIFLNVQYLSEDFFIGVTLLLQRTDHRR